ncbi:putative nuclease HARBI1 isoform X1 [Acipenser ruthenus]|uniref:putative nuclease HARBI1 isoform X2 n=1 Tax=Acipenser ruthenus TaxID=7906 RepID=UPI00145BF053|nr:putative nuclease HARBI1 isoform X2 [Acipenser ruthenus]XP_058882743.1 putative nuclease HARBI1 isoform X1 [Acipenser ruthenus]
MGIYSRMEYALAFLHRRERRRRYQNRVFRTRVSFLNPSDSECISHLQLSKQIIADICQLLQADLERDTGRYNTLPVALKVTAALAFFATGSFQRTVGAIAGISQSAVNGAVHEVTAALVKRAGQFIRFPMSHELQEQTRQEFFLKFGFPRVLGAIDCTHVQLQAPMQNSHIYINRKGVYSVNVQVVCDANNIITHVFANYPGSAHDSFILANSQMPGVFEQDDSLSGWLIGDNGYPLKRWLMTPFCNPSTPAEHRYNRAITSTRSVIESTFGMLKMRFRCLDRSDLTLQYSPQNVSKFFVACCVLHNIAIRNGCRIDLPEDTLQAFREYEAGLHVPIGEAPVAATARQIREHLVQKFFSQ